MKQVVVFRNEFGIPIALDASTDERLERALLKVFRVLDSGAEGLVAEMIEVAEEYSSRFGPHLDQADEMRELAEDARGGDAHAARAVMEWAHEITEDVDEMDRTHLKLVVQHP